MKNLGLIHIVVGLIVLAAVGCKDNSQDISRPNRPPRTFFWLFPDSTIREGNSKQRIRWWGEDPDGIVKGYLFASGKFANGASVAQLPDTLEWRWTTKNDTFLAFPLLVRRDTFGVAISAVDNSLSIDIPEGAY